MRGQIAMPNDEAQQKLKNVDSQFFIENKGQWPSEVLYLTQMGGLNTWITKNGMLYEFYKTEEIAKTSKSDNSIDRFEDKQFKRWGHRISYNLIGNNQTVNSIGKQKQTGYKNYLIGNDTNKHSSNVGLYKEALVKNVYAGIDMRYYFDKGLLRYDYIVNPGADPSQIRFDIEGSEKTYLNTKNELVFTTCFGEVKNADLYCYQEQDKRAVTAKFTKKNEGWAIDLDAYNKNQTLIIDPLIYSTFIGGNSYDYGDAISIDSSGNTYITGRTWSTNYDITPGAFQIAHQFVDVFVTKLNSTGSNLIYSTYLGGDSNDGGLSIAIDNLGAAFITGYSTSSNFNITSGAFQSVFGGNTDVVVSKINSSGTALLYSTYVGGSGNDHGRSIAIDAIGNAYITGSSSSTNFNVTSSAFQTTNDGGLFDIVVVKLNTNGSSLLYSTYIGGNGKDVGYSIALDSSSNIYITGETNSLNFDITPGAFKTAISGSIDGFVTKINSSTGNLIYSTFLGGNGDDFANSIAIDNSSNAYITGETNSTDYNITLGSFQSTSGGGSDVFISKLNSIGSALIYSTLIGGSGADAGSSIALDNLGNAHITGLTNSTNYDITSGAYQSTLGGNLDVFVTKLNSTGASLIYSTYIGGSNNDRSTSIVIDSINNVYITGYTQSTNYDITSGAFQTSLGGNDDVFVTKLCLSNPSLTLTSAVGTISQNISLGAPIINTTYTTTGVTGVTFSGLPTGVTGNWASNTVTISGTPTVTGTFNYTINLNGNCGTTSATGVITVLPSLVANPDTATTTFGVATTPIGNVRANDTYNGSVATSSNTTLSFVSSTNAGITLNTTTGAVSVSATVPAGTYTLIYKICATASPTTCVNGTVTITVSAPLIIANPDTATTNFGVASTPVANVRANDTYNGAVATSSNTTLSFVSSTNAGITLNATTGAVSVSATVPVGTYTLIYKICATGSTTYCSNGTVTITVNPPSLIANADNATTPFGTVTTPIANVRANDTYNGAVATSSNTTLSFVSSTNAGITLNTSTGAVNKTAAVPAGTYTLIYKICATASPATCTNGTVTIVVSPPPVLVAVNDNATINYNNTAITTAIANVRANDTANGAVATASNTTLSLVSSSHSGVTLDVTTGAITANAYVPVGTYTVVYKICSTGSTTNCVNGTATIIVRPVIQAVNDAATVLSGIASSNVVNVRTNDKFNFAAATLSNTTLSVVSTSNSGITLNTSTGMINVASTVPAGVHTLVYNLCSISAPITCATGTVTITVNPIVIANNDSGQSIFSIGGPSINVLNNDTVSGLPATTSNVVITFISSTHPGVTLNTSTGVINVAPTVPLDNTIQARYTVTYRICSVGSTTNCATATATIIVYPKLIAYNDYFTILDNAPYTTVSVLTNDTQNDVAPLQITNYVHASSVSNSSPWVYMGTGGLIVVNPSAPVGTHTVNYKIRWGTYLPEVSSSATAYINVVSSTSSRIEKNEIVKIYPNPSNGIFNLDLSNNSEEYNKITIFNLLGKTIYTNSLNPKSNNEIDLTGFPSGYYLAHIENSLNNTSKQVKLIKQ